MAPSGKVNLKQSAVHFKGQNVKMSRVREEDKSFIVRLDLSKLNQCVHWEILVEMWNVTFSCFIIACF